MVKNLDFNSEIVLVYLIRIRAEEFRLIVEVKKRLLVLRFDMIGKTKSFLTMFPMKFTKDLFQNQVCLQIQF